MITQGLTFFSIVGTALVAGTFFAFSSFVVPALGALPPAEGVSAMQSINAVVLGSAFLVVLLGTAVSSSLLALLGVGAPQPPLVRTLWIIGGALYLAGVLGVTAWGNVPLNEALSNLAPDDARAMWPTYLPTWLAWNHLRTFAATTSLGIQLLAWRLT